MFVNAYQNGQKFGNDGMIFLGGYCEQKDNHLETFAMLELKSSIFMSLYFFRIA